MVDGWHPMRPFAPPASPRVATSTRKEAAMRVTATTIAPPATGNRAQGFMDYTDDACVHQATAISYNGHAGLGADRLSKNEVSIESFHGLPEVDDEVLVAFE